RRQKAGTRRRGLAPEPEKAGDGQGLPADRRVAGPGPQGGGDATAGASPERRGAVPRTVRLGRRGDRGRPEKENRRPPEAQAGSGGRGQHAEPASARAGPRGDQPGMATGRDRPEGGSRQEGRGTGGGPRSG